MNSMHSASNRDESAAANERTENLERDSLDLDEAQDSYRDGSAATTPPPVAAASFAEPTPGPKERWWICFKCRWGFIGENCPRCFCGR